MFKWSKLSEYNRLRGIFPVIKIAKVFIMKTVRNAIQRVKLKENFFFLSEKYIGLGGDGDTLNGFCLNECPYVIILIFYH